MMAKQQKKTQNKLKAKKIALAWSDEAWEDYLHFQEHDPDIAQQINGLLNECRRDPFKGTGKPEPLKGDLTGYWSRRITREHRLVYLPEDNVIYIVQCRYHY
jgi:toxin YoeB